MKSTILILLASLATLGSAAREFTSADGKKIDGELIAHAEDQVTLKVGAREFVIPVVKFSLDDQQFIKEWIAQNPGAVRMKFGFFFDFQEIRGGRVQGKAPGEMIDDKLKTIPNECEMVVFNRGTTPVLDIEVRYEIYIDDFVDVRNNTFTRMAVGGARSAVLETVAGKIEVPLIEAGGRIDFTRNFDTHFYIDRDRGKTDKAAGDKIRGVRLRIYKEGKVVGEERAAERGREVDSIPWQDAGISGETTVKESRSPSPNSR